MTGPKAEEKKNNPSREEYIQHIANSAAANQNQKKGGLCKGPTMKNFCKYHSLFRVITDKKRYPKEMRHAVIESMQPKHVKCLCRAVSAFTKSQGMTATSPPSQRRIKRMKQKLDAISSTEGAPVQLAEESFVTSRQRGGLPFLIPIIASAIVSSALSAGTDAIAGAVRKRKNKNKNKKQK
jgi:hypothetical protein